MINRGTRVEATEAWRVSADGPWQIGGQSTCLAVPGHAGDTWRYSPEYSQLYTKVAVAVAPEQRDLQAFSTESTGSL